MNSPDKFGIGQGREAPAPSTPVEGQPQMPETPSQVNLPHPSKETKPEEAAELVIEAPPQVGEPRREVVPEIKPVASHPANIREGDITGGDLSPDQAANLQDEINLANA